MRRRLAAALGLAALVHAAPAAAETKRFALSMMHFNVQYVAGGLVGFTPQPNPELDKSEAEVEDSIVRESFEPVLDLLGAHPTWGANIELQGYMLDVMAARHQDVLDKLRTLATSGQIEVVSFHYSDQLFLAYPAEDWRRSVALNQATFAAHAVPLSKSVFCQEGQAGIGMATAMAGAGYETLVWPKNLFAYQHGDGDPAPLYRFGDVQMITSRGLSWTNGTDSLDTEWWFVDDGELLATGDYDPYFPEKFKTSPEALAETEASLTALEAAGYSITTVGKYVAAIEGMVPAVDPPPLLDGTWQPNSTDGIKRWLGGFGLWWQTERDNDVRTLGAMAHRELLAAETIAAAAGLDAQDEIAAGFRLLALGQVTDATGINPFRGEIEYGVAHCAEAVRIARDVIERAKAALGEPQVTIDTRTGEATRTVPGFTPGAATAPFEITVDGGDRPSTVEWIGAPDGNGVDVFVRFGAGDGRSLSVTFPGEGDAIEYTPGLLDEVWSAPKSAFVFDHYELALSNGLVGLGGGRFVIKDQAYVHVAAHIVPGSGDVVFRDDTAPSGEETTWAFRVTDGGDESGLAAARAINVTPRLFR